MSQPIPAHLATSPADYARLGIKKTPIALWEDGMRTDGSKGTYEWWYFDTHLDDGSKLVIEFRTKAIVDVDKPMAPQVAFVLDRPDGSHVEKLYLAPIPAFSASKEACDVRIGPNTFQGDLHTYRIHVEIDEVRADVTLIGTVPAWRPEGGSLFFGARDEHFFAWLPAVPQGDMTAGITIAGHHEEFQGIGYHDHNWGNISMVRLMHHWYWARGKIGDYTLIASYITAEKRYGYHPFPVFMLAHQGRIIADDAGKIRFSATDVQADPVTGKPVANVTVYEYRDGRDHYRLTFTRRQTLQQIKLVDTIKGITGVLARLIGFDGAYLRFTGDLTLDHYEGEQLRESEHGEALWELMYFGKVPRNS